MKSEKFDLKSTRNILLLSLLVLIYFRRFYRSTKRTFKMPSIKWEHLNLKLKIVLTEMLRQSTLAVCYQISIHLSSFVVFCFHSKLLAIISFHWEEIMSTQCHKTLSRLKMFFSSVFLSSLCFVVFLLSSLLFRLVYV